MIPYDMIHVIFAQGDLFFGKMPRCFQFFGDVHLQGSQKLIKPSTLPADLDGAGHGSIVQDVFLAETN